MSTWALVALLACFVTYQVVGSGTYDCDNPTSGYICDEGRYYKVLNSRLWQSAHDECESDGAQLAIAYSAEDIVTMNRVIGNEGEYLADMEFIPHSVQGKILFHLQASHLAPWSLTRG